ncbi:serine hydrolase [Paenibacillus sp. UNC499MF]|uniref:serine hydrolase domain-containing protein n=1 Tax=Paenibacillus sp. UNC499MF TaxID=1502751 RepID=UPI00089FBAFD|nr:serine hydrolase domain-containing protein [Paenibacillus sp. UNC499MF]SEG70678.1 CubicO group peptidase, beta-lactamase class C family [Paenibacillus sp. UNC499MF]
MKRNRLNRLLDEKVLESADGGSFDGTVLVAVNGDIVLHEAYGWANRELEAASRPDTVYRIGSVTKPLTAAAVMRLAAKGALRTEDPVAEYVPGFPSGDRITLRHLLMHTSGIPNLTEQPSFAEQAKTRRSVDELIALFRGKPLEFEPGSRFKYSNSGYILLGKVIEAASGHTYSSYMKENVFEPAGMSASGLDDNRSLLQKRAAGYEFDASGMLCNASHIDMSNAFAAGGLYSTAADLYRWDKALRENRLLPEDIQSDMYQLHNPAGYGYGWFNQSEPDGTVYHHGGINGFSSSFVRDLKRGITVIVLSNTASVTPSVLSGELHKLAVRADGSR